MGFGRWPRPRFEPAHEGDEHSFHNKKIVVELRITVGVEVCEVPREEQEVLHLCGRTEGDPEEVPELAIPARRAFRDVRGDGRSRPAELARDP